MPTLFLAQSNAIDELFTSCVAQNKADMRLDPACILMTFLP